MTVAEDKKGHDKGNKQCLLVSVQFGPAVAMTALEPMAAHNLWLDEWYCPDDGDGDNAPFFFHSSSSSNDAAFDTEKALLEANDPDMGDFSF
jgi:hypothetical protein